MIQFNLELHNCPKCGTTLVKYNLITWIRFVILKKLKAIILIKK